MYYQMKLLTLISIALAGSPNADESKQALRMGPPPAMSQTAALALIGQFRGTLTPNLNAPALIALITSMNATHQVSANSLIKLVTIASSGTTR
jgi:hypothetical protein